MNIYESVNENLNEGVRLSERGEEVKAFFTSIDFAPLVQKIREVIGDDSVLFTEGPDLGKFDYDRWNVEISSENIADKCGVMSCVYEKVLIKNFGGGISTMKDSIDANEENENDLFLWLPINFQYTYKDGGFNGTELLRANYTSKDRWKFNK